MSFAVSKYEREPLLIVWFKWLLIVLGLAMLVAVLVIMGDVIYVWWSGGGEENK